MPSTGLPVSKTAWGARGVSSPITEAGPPERMIAWGANAFRKASSTLLKGWISQ
jgi:hypothetical protein